jgi:endonuclease/exonuclease/phosphatase family metal-dependent hydrolase
MGRHLESLLAMQEVFRTSHGKYAKTFPSHWPILKMDRIYFNHLKLLECQCLNGQPWKQLSDHLPLYARFEY